MKPPSSSGAAAVRDDVPYRALSGYLTVLLPAVLLAAALAFAARSGPGPGGTTVPGAAVAAAAVLCLYGFLGLKIVYPGRAAVVTFLGSYRGTVPRAGFIWVFPICRVQLVDVRTVNLATDQLKVNDATGNPIEIAAIVVFQVAQPARSIFNIGGQLEEFVKIQAESALRVLAGEYAYDATEADPAMESLRDSTEILADRLRQSLQGSVDLAGVAVASARISHLAYAPEIAPVMLRRQQAEALMVARKKIAGSAVAIAVSAVGETERGLHIPAGALSEVERFRLAGRLLVTLCGQAGVQPTLPLEG